MHDFGNEQVKCFIMKQKNDQLLESRLQKSGLKWDLSPVPSNLKLDDFLEPRAMMEADQLRWLSVTAKRGKPSPTRNVNFL